MDLGVASAGREEEDLAKVASHMMSQAAQLLGSIWCLRTELLPLANPTFASNSTFEAPLTWLVRLSSAVNKHLSTRDTCSIEVLSINTVLVHCKVPAVIYSFQV